jgi:hypothetical protein
MPAGKMPSQDVQYTGSHIRVRAADDLHNMLALAWAVVLSFCVGEWTPPDKCSFQLQPSFTPRTPSTCLFNMIKPISVFETHSATSLPFRVQAGTIGRRAESGLLTYANANQDRTPRTNDSIVLSNVLYCYRVPLCRLGCLRQSTCMY